MPLPRPARLASPVRADLALFAPLHAAFHPDGGINAGTMLACARLRRGCSRLPHIAGNDLLSQTRPAVPKTCVACMK